MHNFKSICDNNSNNNKGEYVYLLCSVSFSGREKAKKKIEQKISYFFVSQSNIMNSPLLDSFIKIMI